MQPEFWHERWRSRRIGFHRDVPLPLLIRHWPSLGLAHGSRVFVPLCGKSLDMVWLAEQGHRVLGIELSELAIAQFFEERGLTPAIRTSQAGIHYAAGPWELIAGDAFAIPGELLADCAGVYDRAALIALPPELRPRYVRELRGLLKPGAFRLVVTLEYDQALVGGPPFSVLPDEMRRYWPDLERIQATNEIATAPPKFRSARLESVVEAVWSSARP